MKNGSQFLWESINMLCEQTFKDFEIIICKEGKMAENTNAGIKRAKGELIKILYLDDRLAHKNVLQEIVDNFKGQWMIVGSDDNQYPYWTNDIHQGNNKLGSPSALVIRNDSPMLFDENMSWLLDCDYYRRMYDKYGEPVILDGEYVVLGKGDHQMTHILTTSDKQQEDNYMKNKYGKTT